MQATSWVNRLLPAAATAVALTSLIACGASIVVWDSGGTLRIGVWAGDHISLAVTESTASLEFDCGHGWMNLPLSLDAKGEFSATGEFVRDGPGPVQTGSAKMRYAASYSGSVDGDRMQLRVVVPNLGLQLGPFALTLGGPPRLVKCY